MHEWFVKELHGNVYQNGFPDLFAAHAKSGTRWIEVKLPTGSRLEQSQRDTFGEFTKRNIGVWILTDDSDWEFNKLFGPSNWTSFLEIMKPRPRYGKPQDSTPTRPQKDGPERRIQEEIKKVLTADDWYVKDTFGSIYQYGMPDLYACHKLWGARWIEVKNPDGYTFTPAQRKTFPLLMGHGVGVWILQDPSETSKLYQPMNWMYYLKW